jgi:hypothetical protein
MFGVLASMFDGLLVGCVYGLEKEVAGFRPNGRFPYCGARELGTPTETGPCACSWR